MVGVTRVWLRLYNVQQGTDTACIYGVLLLGFSESDLVDMDAPYPPDRSSSIGADDYSHASDSDLHR